MEMHGHAWRYLAAMCRRERERLSAVEPLGNMLPLMAACDSLNDIECSIPAEHWPDHESRDEGPVQPMTITIGDRDADR